MAAIRNRRTGGVGKNVTEFVLEVGVGGGGGRLGGVDDDINRSGQMNGADDGAQPSLDAIPDSGLFRHDRRNDEAEARIGEFRLALADNDGSPAKYPAGPPHVLEISPGVQSARATKHAARPSTYDALWPGGVG